MSQNAMDNRIERMKELIRILNEASRAYYSESREIMPNERYDALYDELCRLQDETGTVFSDSPTERVGYEVLSSLPKEKHEKAALSLDKTKEVATLQAFLGNQEGILSWKLDGLTIVLTYENGELVKAVTRGNGEIGEIITGNARTFVNLPLRIPYRGHLVLRGEAVISYSDFNRMNETNDDSEKYKNPRNLSAGSVRQLDPKITKERSVRLIAFSLISADGIDFQNSFEKQLHFLKEQGFTTVDYIRVSETTLPDAVKTFSERIKTYDIPSDGLVLVLDDLQYGESLGRTAKFPRNAIAFKWRDEMAETTLRNVFWSASRTGLINPVAVFDPVELEGTTVTRASVHNVSIVRELALGIGDKVLVYKANMIIPQISENLTKSNTLPIPPICPVCGEPTTVRDENGVKTLFCTNPSCPAKEIKRFSLLVSRNALSIDGLSEATLEKWIDAGFIKTPADLFRLARFKEDIIEMDGFGEKSYQNIQKAIEKARDVSLERFLYALGIPGIGVAGAKTLASFFGRDFEKVLAATKEELMECEDIGEVTAEDIVSFFADKKKLSEIEDLLSEIRFVEETNENAPIYAGKTFVITGDVHHFPNRDALKKYIEDRAGKVSSAVSKKTTALINNDILSSSTKNKQAKELGIPILTEDEFLNG